MDNVLENMLQSYCATKATEQKNAIKEVMQEVVLCGLARAGFFEKAAFYGGTALRVFYGLERLYEDLDFSLMVRDEQFQLSSFFPALREEAVAFGFNVTISEIAKTKDSAIRSAFLKGNTKEHILMFYAENADLGVSKDEAIKIKFEVDTMPPDGAKFEKRYRLLPVPYSVILYDMPSLFAGKLHAVLCRGWKHRVKGRDLFDLVFYFSRGATVNMRHLKARLVESGAWEDARDLTVPDVKRMLSERFETIDYDRAKEDVVPFIRDVKQLDVWSVEFFQQIIELLK